jgi:hypothetical protein
VATGQTRISRGAVPALRVMTPGDEARRQVDHRRVEVQASVARMEQRAKHHLGQLRVVGVGREALAVSLPEQLELRHAQRAILGSDAGD